MKLSTQFALVFIPLLALSGAGTTTLARKAVHKIILEEAANRAQLQLEAASSLAIPGFETHREDLLLPILASITAHEGALYSAAVTPDGRILAHTDVLEKGKLYETKTQVQDAKPSLFRERRYGGQSILEVTRPVWSHETAKTSEELLLLGSSSESRKRLGSLQIGLPLDQAVVTERKISGRLVLLLVVADGLLLAFGFFLIHGVLRPVARLARATEEIVGGVYGATIPLPAASELANLATRFNRMSQMLAQTTVSKDFLDSIFKDMLEPLIVLNSALVIERANRAALEMIGYGVEEVVGQPLTLLGETLGEIPAAILSTGSARDLELLIKPKQGPAMPALVSGSALKDKDGQITGFIVVAKDIRERKKLESEMRQSEKLSAVGKLASGVAHEINNPLGVILGFAQAALWDVKPGDDLEFPLKSIERETIRCKNLVQDLLTFSRASKGEREPVEINKAVESAFSLVSAQARLGKIQVTKELAPSLPRVLGNLNQLQQVVINLANNALDAMNDAGTLTVKTELRMAGASKWIVLSVADTGSGIPTDVLPRIFEPFYTTKPVGKGTGLGLGLVHEIIEKHSGFIEVESCPGKTIFTVRLPVESSIKTIV